MSSAGAPCIAVVGGGFSGLLTAIHLLERMPAAVVRLVEKAPRFGLGRAYAAANPDHLLNVRAANMSAFPDRPDHFKAWLEARDVAGDGFVSRGLYGVYLQELLREAIGPEGHPGRLLLEQDEAVDVEPRGGRAILRLAMGREIEVDAVVLAVGLAAPASESGEAGNLYVPDPWTLDPAAAPEGEILLIGSGLTMVDVALSLDRPGRRFLAISRRGLLPRPHGPAPAVAAPEGPFATPREAMTRLRAHAAQVGWRSAVDSVRPLTPSIWAGWDLKARRRFLRHARPWWDVHRHRMAPRVAARIDEMTASGRLRIVAGQVVRLRAEGEALGVVLRPRGGTRTIRLSVAAAVDCTGLSGDLTRLPLLARLEARGLLRGDPLGLGLDVDGSLRVVGSDGRPTRGLYAVGPLTRAARWETLAAPDLRNQTDELAATIHADLATGADRASSGRICVP
ncbi:FAD/NAD(P)-binding protein [Phenylobacterium sp.]|uniref:FAD/NAD(P)-binding protein n=1 Tax=Phenylobacterium sp. TaxID=1871053 RepID=UPI00301D667F